MYLGLTKAAMADALGMAERSYTRIEIGERECPPGLLDTVEEVVEKFDDAVDDVADTTPDPTVQVGDIPGGEWYRAVVGRAAVITAGKITPILVR